MNYQDQAMQREEFKPGKLCTVLAGKRMYPISCDEYYSPFRGWPLRVRWVDPGSPFVLFDVLKGKGAGEHLPPKVLLDLRRASFCAVSREYAMQMLGQKYQTTL